MPMTMTYDEMKQLALLARVELTDAEIEGFSHDFDSILNYVGQMNNVDVSSVEVKPLQCNSARNDENPTESGQYVEKMLTHAPDSQDGFYKVPKIL